MTKTTKLSDLQDGTTVTVRIKRTVVTATVAASDAARSHGLGGAAPLAVDRGMLFVASPHDVPVFTMRGVTFPIDIVWITAGTVSEVTPNVRPQPGVPDAQLTRYKPSSPVEHVLEVPAGWAAQHGIKPGDPVAISSS
jgi:uncharacterized membrane protein (UPF0127 family)